MNDNNKALPINFMTFLFSLAGAVQMSLGVVPNPQTGKTEKNLKVAKETIDILEMLQQKTKGNLTKDEEDLFEHILYEVRMKFLESTNDQAPITK